jgi:hypothetical protein
MTLNLAIATDDDGDELETLIDALDRHSDYLRGLGHTEDAVVAETLRLRVENLGA